MLVTGQQPAHWLADLKVDRVALFRLKINTGFVEEAEHYPNYFCYLQISVALDACILNCVWLRNLFPLFITWEIHYFWVKYSFFVSAVNSFYKHMAADCFYLGQTWKSASSGLGTSGATFSIKVASGYFWCNASLNPYRFLRWDFARVLYL